MPTGLAKEDDAQAPWPVRWAVPLLLLATVFAVFSPALEAGFLDWDDDELLVRNHRFRALDQENLIWMFTTSHFGHFQPLTWLSYALDYAIWKTNPLGYHLTNLILHAGTALLFYFVAGRLMQRAIGSTGDRRSSIGVLSAAFAAIFFACHPLRVESVAWVTERRDVLSGFFYVACVAVYLRYAAARTTQPFGASRGGRGLLYSTALLLCLLSLLAKASGMSIAVILLILDWYPLRRWSWERGIGSPAARWVWLEKLPFLVLGLACAGRALYAQSVRGITVPLDRHDWPARFAQGCHGLVFYLQKTLWPTQLSPIYPFPPRSEMLGSMFWTSLAVLIPLIVLAWGRRKQWPGLAAALVAYAVTVFPVLGVAQSGPQFVADRYSYHSCLGIAVLGGWLMLWPWRAKNRPTRSWPAVSVSLAALVVVVFLGVAAYRQTRVWQNSLSLWEHAVKVTPHSSVAHANYATALAREKRFNDALPHYERALQIDPNDFVAWHHMGDLYLSTGRPREAIESYRRTLVLAPSRRGVHLILGDLLIGQGKYEEALVVLRDGAKRNPTAYDLFDYLADFLATFPDPSLRNGDEAVYWASKSSDGRGQQSARGLLTLATAFAEAGQLDEAVKTAEKALSLATAESNQKLAADLQHRLQLFRSGRPYHYGD